MKKIILVFVFLFFCNLGLFAKEYVVAFAQDNMANDFRKAQVLEVQNALKEYPKIKFIYSDAKGQTSMFIYQVEEFINKNVDVLILGTNDADAIVPSLKKAYQKDLKTIILDRGVNTNQYTTFINSDNIKIGEIGGEYIAKQLKSKGVVLLLEGLQTADVTHLRTKGFMSVISKHKDIKVIKATANYLRRDAIIEVEKLLSKGVKFDAIFAESDSMISGARSALIKHKIDVKTIITVGCDYTSEAQKAIKKGTQTGSVKFPLGGKESAKVAVDLINGKKVKKHIVIPVKLVNRDNVKKVEPIF